MSILNKSFEQIEFADIQALITNEVTEDQNLEYKKIPWKMDSALGGSDEQTREMLRDISAMANKLGGYIIIGVEEDGLTGKAVAIHNVIDAEQVRDSINASVITNIQPKIFGLQIKCLGDEHTKIIIIHIPNSTRKPHIIIFKGAYQFWMRHDRQKSVMSVDDIREEFYKGVEATDKMTDFFATRKEYFMKLGPHNPSFVISALPLNNFEEIIDTHNQAIREVLQRGATNKTDSFNLDFSYLPVRPSLNGLAVGREDEKRELNLYRNGFLEFRANVNSITRQSPQEDSGEDKLIINRAVVEFIYNFTLLLKELSGINGFEGPYVINVNFFLINGYGILPYRHGSIDNREVNRWKDWKLEIPQLVYEYIDPIKITKELGDRIWQAFGFENEPFFKEGAFKFNP